jgi:hypothetical protein
MFSIPKPQFVAPAKTTDTADNAQKKNKKIQNSDSQRLKAYNLQMAVAPLTPTGQPFGGGIGFFEQGIITGLVVFVLPVFIGAIAAGTYATKYIHGKWLVRS